MQEETSNKKLVTASLMICPVFTDSAVHPFPEKVIKPVSEIHESTLTAIQAQST
jgi:hypothetical protein